MVEIQEILFSNKKFSIQEVEEMQYNDFKKITEYFFSKLDRDEICENVGLNYYFSVLRILAKKTTAPRPHVYAHVTRQLNKAIERKREELPNAQSDTEPSNNILEIMTR